MTLAGSPRSPSPVPALSVLCLLLALLGAVYYQLLAASDQRRERAQRTFERVAWIAAAEPAWRAKLDALRHSLDNDAPFLRAAQPQSAAAELQSRVRQALMAAGGTIESLQSNVAAPASGNLPSIRAVIVTRTAPERIMDILQALEGVEPPLSFESVDIATQQIGGKDSPQRVATLTIAVRTFVLGDGNAGE